MVNEPSEPGEQVYDRWFLLGEKRNEPLALQEVQQYGRDSFGDPDYVSVYGLKPHQWYARGVRILGRTAVECTRDQLAALIGRDIAAAARAGLGRYLSAPGPAACQTATSSSATSSFPRARCIERSLGPVKVGMAGHLRLRCSDVR